jgi:hypothetical protein
VAPEEDSAEVSSEEDLHAIQAILNYIDAQKHINLGLHTDAIAPRLHTGGIGYPLWSTPGVRRADIGKWGPVFAEKITYIKTLQDREIDAEISFIDPLKTNDDFPIDPSRLGWACGEWKNAQRWDMHVARPYHMFMVEYNKKYPKEGGAVTYFELAYLIHNEQPFRFELGPDSKQPEEYGELNKEYPGIEKITFARSS